MVVALKVPLYPTREQAELFHKMANIYHNLKNKAVDYIKNYDNYVSEKDLRQYLISTYSGDLPISFIANLVAKEKIAARIAHGFSKLRFQRYSDSHKAFPVRCDTNGNRVSRIYSDDYEYIKIPSINGLVKMSRLWVNKMKKKSCISILNFKKQTARVTYDGKYWYLVFTYNIESPSVNLKDNSIGVDVGIKHLAVTSDNEVFDGVNNTSDKVKKLEIKKKKLQRVISNKYRQNKSYKKSENIKKSEQRLYLITRKLKNIRENELHHISKYLVDKHYRLIVFEDLNIRGMLKNKHLSSKISNQCWYKLMQFTKYKAEFINEEFKKIERFKPSSKACSKCGNIKKNLLLSDRVYVCENCGLVIDRDLNAAINIKNFATN